MKKFYMILAAVTAMTMSAQAQSVGTVEVGDFVNPTEIYNASYFDIAPTNFYLAHTGAQMIYTVDELADMQDKTDVEITAISFKFRNDCWYDDIVRDVKIYMEAIDDTQFAVNENGVKQFFNFDNQVYEANEVYAMLEIFGEDAELRFDLDEPFALEAGKTLLVTIVFDAEDDDNCTGGSDDVPFYTSGIRSKCMVYTDNWTSFLNYEEFPDATAMLGCGTSAELPVTLFDYTYGAGTTAIQEVKAAAQDGAYYNLMGQTFTEGNMPAGIYIHNGQKIVVK
jgi:hypothetical protein